MTGEATVVKNAGSHYMLSMLPDWNPFPAVLKGRIRLKSNDSTIRLRSGIMSFSKQGLKLPAK